MQRPRRGADVESEGHRPGEAGWKALGEFVRAQRELANLSLRQLAEMARISNPYLSQIERGIHRPSAQVIKGIADALQISAESLYAQAGLLDSPERRRPRSEVEEAIRLDPRLSTEQKEALIVVYRSFLTGQSSPGR